MSPASDSDRLSRVSRVFERARPFLPWLSLATGVAGAVFMNRTPGRAWLVVVAAVAGWIALVLWNIVERRRLMTEAADVTTRGARAARFAVVFSNNVAMQQALMFPLPFYVKATGVLSSSAAAPQIEHAAFFLAYATALVVVLWDPLFRRALSSLLPSIALQAFAAFVGLDMVLPVLGLSNAQALVVAGAATAAGAPIAVLLRPEWKRWRHRGIAAVAAAVIVGLAWFGAPLVPPAPLELVSVGIGTGVVDKELVGAADVVAAGELACHSAIKAPLGLKDELFHVWTVDGVRYDPVRLDVRGGRDLGFRTWSKQPVPRAGARVRCAVETASGQVLGSARVRTQ